MATAYKRIAQIAAYNFNRVLCFTNNILIFALTKKLKGHERRYIQHMIIVNVKEGESLDRALKRFKKKFEKTGVLRELRSRQAYEKRSVTRRTQVKKAIYKQSLNQDNG